MHDATLLQHLGEEEKIKGAVSPPVFLNSLYVFDDLDQFIDRDRRPDGYVPFSTTQGIRGDEEISEPLPPAPSPRHEPFVEKGSFGTPPPSPLPTTRAIRGEGEGRGHGYSYSRLGNPSVTIVEKKVAALERTEKAKVFGSGMAAISASILACVEQGSHVVCVDTSYGPTRQFLSEYLPKFGVSTTFVSGLSTDEVMDATRPETSLVILESPGSIIFRLQDFRAITSACKEKRITTMTDNSYSAAVFQKPATMGVDVVVQTATKYLAGHSDLVAGTAAGTEAFIDRLMMRELQWIGSIIHPFGAWQMMRGMRTLALRMKHAQEQGNAMCAWLKEQPWVDRVFHVGDPCLPQASLRDAQMTGTASLLSFAPKDQSDEWTRAFVKRLQIFQLGVSWGGFESLAVPLDMEAIGYDGPKRLVRLYVGLEDFEDLAADLSGAAAHSPTS